MRSKLHLPNKLFDCHSESQFIGMKNLFYSRDSRFRGNDNISYILLPQKILFLTILFTLILTACTDAQVYSDEDEKIYKSTFQFAVDENLSAKPISEVIVEIGKSFIGTGYAAHTLEVNDGEILVINLTELDCNTFVENVLAISRCIKHGKTSFEDFKDELTLIRYRDGKIDQYPSRLHYFTDWIYNNEEKSIVKNISKESGGEKLELNLSFMSSHPEYYKHLKAKPEFIPIIAEQEEEINKREHFFIPKGKIEEIEIIIKSGDLLAFTSTIEGLDVNHVGIAVRMDDDRIHLLHAPNVGYKVQITDLPLAEYVKQIEKDSGVIVVRILENADPE